MFLGMSLQVDFFCGPNAATPHHVLTGLSDSARHPVSWLRHSSLAYRLMCRDRATDRVQKRRNYDAYAIDRENLMVIDAFLPYFVDKVRYQIQYTTG